MIGSDESIDSGKPGKQGYDGQEWQSAIFESFVEAISFHMEIKFAHRNLDCTTAIISFFQNVLTALTNEQCPQTGRISEKICINEVVSVSFIVWF